VVSQAGSSIGNHKSDVLGKVIDLVNRWCKKEAANNPMWHVYMQVKSALPTMLKFSKAL
jgi:hypothetical protein